MDLVIDASVAMGWLLQSQADPLTVAAEQTIARGIGWVPCHFGIEVARTLRGHERRGLLKPESVDEALALLHDMPLVQDTSDALDVIDAAIALARRHRLRVADAAYLELALRTGLPLATRDAALAAASTASGAALFRGP